MIGILDFQSAYNPWFVDRRIVQVGDWVSLKKSLMYLLPTFHWFQGEYGA